MAGIQVSKGNNYFEMNIFYLNKDPKIAAMEHNDKHCVKMILEYAQMLSTAHRELDGDEIADELMFANTFLLTEAISNLV